MTPPVTPFSLKDAPALIERILPVRKLSAEAYSARRWMGCGARIFSTLRGGHRVV